MKKKKILHVRHWKLQRTSVSSQAHRLPCGPLSTCSHFVFESSLGNLPLRHHLLCREPGPFLSTVNPVLSQVCSHRTPRIRWAPQDVNPREALAAQASCTAGTLAASRMYNWAVLRIVGVCLSVETYTNLNPHAHTTHTHARHNQAGLRWLLTGKDN